MALSETTQESIYLLKLLCDIDIDHVYKPVVINCDNQGALALVKNPVKHSRT